MDQLNIDQVSKVKHDADFLNSKITSHFTSEVFLPRILVICGSGLGGITSEIQENPAPLHISYSEIPNFKNTSVEGHDGILIFGYINKVPVVLMKGRLHSYEGHKLHETVHPLRVLKELDCITTAIITNASGGLNKDFQASDLMCINDHLSLLSLAGNNPLVGPNLHEYGPRFLPMGDVYDYQLRKLLFKKHRELKMERRLHEGAYFHCSGPSYETRSEYRFARIVGCEAIGMSTAPEVIVAKHCGWKVLGISLIANICNWEPCPKASSEDTIPTPEAELSHEEVLYNCNKASFDLQRLISSVIGEL